MSNIPEILKHFSPIQLNEMDGVKLMNRTDTKYFFHISRLPEILSALRSSYSVLEIDSKRIMKYKSTYFDTCNYRMYTQHQNGKGNRYKIRKREYVDSSISFLEIKFKTNKGRTLKDRVPNHHVMHEIQTSENDFISEKSPYQSNELNAVIRNSFERITLVHKTAPERITIDMNLRFKDFNQQALLLPGLCIIEVKKDSNASHSDAEILLKESGILPNNFSKYLIGTMLLNPQLKYNRSKKKLLKLRKLNVQPQIIHNHEHRLSYKLRA